MAKKLQSIARANQAIRHACTMTIFSPYDFFALEMPSKQRQQNQAEKNAKQRKRPASVGGESGDSPSALQDQGFLCRKSQMMALAIETEVWHSARDQANWCRGKAREYRDEHQKVRRRLLTASSAALTDGVECRHELEDSEEEPRMFKSRVPHRQPLPPSLLAAQHFQVLPVVQRRQSRSRAHSAGENLGRPAFAEPYIARCYTPPSCWFSKTA